MSTRYFITHVYDPPTSVDQTLGDMKGMVVDVKGHTIVKFPAMYLNQKHALQVHLPNDVESDANGYLVVYRLTTITSPDLDSDPPVRINVFGAVGEDMRFIFRTGFLNAYRNTLHAEYTAPPAKRVGQCDVLKEFHKPFNGINDKFIPEAGYLSGEDFGTIREFMHRPATFIEDNSVDYTRILVAPRIWPANPVAAVNYGVNDYICSMFRFYRGGVRLFGFCTPGGAPEFVSNAPATYFPGNSTTSNADVYDTWSSGLVPVVNSTAGKWFSVEIPWYKDAPIKAIQSDCPYHDSSASTSNLWINVPSVNYEYAWASGDDFQLGTYKPCLFYTVAAEASKDPAPSPLNRGDVPNITKSANFARSIKNSTLEDSMSSSTVDKVVSKLVDHLTKKK
jgi:hypothetical protein